jgi:hypothetical protein
MLENVLAKIFLALLAIQKYTSLAIFKNILSKSLYHNIHVCLCINQKKEESYNILVDCTVVGVGS